jgi:hypothetical protein
MRVRSLVLALMLASGLASAATKHPKPPKVAKHATVAKAVKRGKPAVKAANKARKPATVKHPATRKVAKRKAPKVKKHKA